MIHPPPSFAARLGSSVSDGLAHWNRTFARLGTLALECCRGRTASDAYEQDQLMTWDDESPAVGRAPAASAASCPCPLRGAA